MVGRLVANLWFALLALTVPLVHANNSRERLDEIRKGMGGLGYGTSREEIDANRDRRKRQLRNLINDMRQKLADHSAGEKILKPEEKAEMEKRMDIFQRKYDSMKVDMDDRVSNPCIIRHDTFTNQATKF
jgi:hypothetical protein